MTTAVSLTAGLLIDEKLITQSSGGIHQHIYPATGEPNVAVPLAGGAEIGRAVSSAWHAHRVWMSLTCRASRAFTKRSRFSGRTSSSRN